MSTVTLESLAREPDPRVIADALRRKATTAEQRADAAILLMLAQCGSDRAPVQVREPRHIALGARLLALGHAMCPDQEVRLGEAWLLHAPTARLLRILLVLPRRLRHAVALRQRITNKALLALSKDAEVLALVAERCGMLSALCGRVLDRSADGTLHAIDHEGIAARSLVVTCPSTGRTHILLVPMDMTTAHEARIWTLHGVTPDVEA